MIKEIFVAHPYTHYIYIYIYIYICNDKGNLGSTPLHTLYIHIYIYIYIYVMIKEI